MVIRQYIVAREIDDLLGISQIRRGRTYFSNPKSSIVDQHPGGWWRIVGNETGARGLKHGSATVICGLAGQPLKPFFEEGGFARFGGTDLVEIGAVTFPNQIVITIDRVTIDRHGKVQTSPWSVSVLPEDSEVLEDKLGAMARFAQAAKAAIDKARCKDCRHIHFSVYTVRRIENAS